MGNTISISLSILQVGGYILLLNWACSLRLPMDSNESIVSITSELRRAIHITGGFFISLCIPFSKEREWLCNMKTTFRENGIHKEIKNPPVI